MPSRAARGELLFDLRSFGRAGPARRTLLPAQVAQLARTVARAPEVMVKVSGGAKSTGGAIAHLQYIDRHGELEVETDDGRTLQGKDVAIDLADSWDLDADESRNRTPYRGRTGRAPGKLVHNVVFSMPKGTPPKKLKSAVRVFAREQFSVKHRYALVLHTDQDHPHVHLVVKAMSEDGQRLNIRKATLQEWRDRFAEQLRAHGVAADATSRAVRGQIRSPFKDGIYRAARRGRSTHLRERVGRIDQQLRSGGFEPPLGKAKLAETRRAVVTGWRAAADALLEAGHGAIADKIWGFIGKMAPPMPTDEQIAAKLLQHALAHSPVKLTSEDLLPVIRSPGSARERRQVPARDRGAERTR